MIRSAGFLLLIGYSLCDARPVIHKIEPPNWWVGMRWDTLQLMVYGTGLGDLDARFKAGPPHVIKVHRVDNSAYCFVDVHVPSSTAPGTFELRFTTAAGFDTTLFYDIKQRESASGKFQGFDPRDVIYLITPDRFSNGDTTNDHVHGYLEGVDRSQPYGRHGGDIQGIIDRLDYLKELGVTTIWPNPLVENKGRSSYHGYAATDLYSIDPRFGTNELYRRFVQESRDRGLKVIMDHVNNHIGIQHPWIENLPMMDWLNGSVEQHRKPYHGKIELTDIYSDSLTKSRATDGWFTSYMPDLNQRNPYVRKYLIQSTLWWIEFSGIDGIREDTFPYLDQQFAAEWCAAVRREYPTFGIVGEVWVQDPAYLAPYQAGGRYGVDTHLPTLTDFGLFDAFMKVYAGNESVSAIHAALTKDFLYPDPSVLVTFLDNHDVRRIAFHLQNDTRKLKQALTILLTTRGIPQILYGTEIGMVGGRDHGTLRADFPGGFPGDKRNAFSRTGRTRQENDVFDHVQKLLAVRKKHTSLSVGHLTHFPPEEEVYVYLRSHHQDRTLIVVNNNSSFRDLSLAPFLHHLEGVREFRNLLDESSMPLRPDFRLRIPPFTASLFHLVRQ